LTEYCLVTARLYQIWHR